MDEESDKMHGVLWLVRNWCQGGKRTVMRKNHYNVTSVCKKEDGR